jgi:hypothetical protein
MVQVGAEHLLAVIRVLAGLQDVGMPELVGVFAHRDFLGVFGVLHQHAEEVLVRDLDGVRVLVRPAFPAHGVHHSDFDGFDIESLYRGEDLVCGAGG